MERINPYAVMRNTATYEAYRAYGRAAMKGGLGLVFVGMSLPALWLPVEMFVLRRFGQPKVAALPLFFSLLFAPAVLSGLLVLIGALKMRRFRREHPIPDEWRQVPPVSWPPAAGQTFASTRRRVL